jgi:Domain of unknown function (DUF4395)
MLVSDASDPVLKAHKKRSSLMTTQNSKKRNFVLQQGFQEMLSGDGCSLQYAALQFQPRVILVWLMAATMLQSPLAFVSLSAVLWWSALLPRLNPFDAVYNMALGRRAGAFRISRAPAPRRTAQAIAGGLALVSATLIYAGLTMAAYGVEALFVAAVLALTIGGFCLGSFAHHLFAGDGQFARKTLPWAR